MNVFFEAGLYEALIARRKNMNHDVESQDQNYMLNANEVELIRHFTDKYHVEPVTLNEDQISVTSREEAVPTQGRPMRRQVVRHHIPFSGDREMLKLKPSSGIMWTQDVPVSDCEIMLDQVDNRNDPSQIKREFDAFLKNVKTQATNSASEIVRFNDGLEESVKEAVGKRKTELLRQANLVAALGVPLKKADSVPSTFAVPPPKKRIIIPKPVASKAAFAPEPTLPDSAYKEILKVIHDTGVEIERHPSIYEGKNEEPLRDLFLMVLSANFQSITGETFNKEGKTDILIRHEGKNLFVAECAVWGGIKSFVPKIDQLLSYLTWRDSKTAIICFVKNKDFTSVVEAIKNAVPTHARFLKEEAPVAEAWLRYLFTLPDDRNRIVHLSILCFHMP